MSLIFHKVNGFLDCIEWTHSIYRIGERTIILISWPLQWAQLSYYVAH